MNVTAYVDGLNIWSEADLGRGAFRTIIEPWAIREAISPPAITRHPKPTDKAILAAPDWYDMLLLASRVLVGVFSIHPSVTTVASIQFSNPSFGFVFHESDTLIITESIVQNCARALLGNKMEAGSIIVNRTLSFRFAADCRTAVDIWLHIEEEYAIFNSERLATAISEISATSKSAISFTWAA